MRQLYTLVLFTVFLTALSAVSSVAAQEPEPEVKVAATSGRVDYLANQATEWAALRDGQPVAALDQLRSGTSSWARLLFSDGSVVLIGPDSWLRLDEVSFEAGKTKIFLRLLVGQLRAVAGPSFPAEGRFEVETPTAVASVHGTEFIVVYDADKEETQVVALRGEVEVLGVLGVLGRPVVLSAGMITTVHKGSFPVAASKAPQQTMSDLTRRLELAVSPDDTLLAGYTGGNTQAVSEAPSSIGEWPEEVGKKAAAGPPTLARLYHRPVSREGVIIDQPIHEYTLTPPGQTPPGNVTVVISGSH